MQFEEGQTYICTQSNESWWTEGKEYHVFFDDVAESLAIEDNQGTIWYEHELNEPSLSPQKFKLKEETTMTDLIDNQAHYKNQGIEPIDIMKSNMTKEQYYGFLFGNLQKYITRHEQKNKVEDLKKAKTYLTWMIEEWENGNKK